MYVMCGGWVFIFRGSCVICSTLSGGAWMDWRGQLRLSKALPHPPPKEDGVLEGPPAPKGLGTTLAVYGAQPLSLFWLLA